MVRAIASVVMKLLKLGLDLYVPIQEQTVGDKLIQASLVES